MANRLAIILFMHLLILSAGMAVAEEPRPSDDSTATGEGLEYHTPLAGEPFHTVFMGETVDVPARDRGHVNALTLGGTFYTPKQGNTTFSPIGAFYIKRVWENWRTR